MAQADPTRACAGWGTTTYPVTASIDESGHTAVVYHWAGSCGGGAVDGRDGFPQVGPLCALGGLILPNAETFEQLLPVRILKQEMRCDAAGAGEFRGGSGVEYVVEVEEPSEYSFRAEGLVKASGFGCNGGTDGVIGKTLVSPVGREAFAPPPYGVVNVAQPARMEIVSPSGGGWGDPLARDPERVWR